ncbi:hypothetical protein RJ641_025646 [Dillenia turbinata]|uniref:Peptidase C14 caspase domain-containing protein n=1 Tax=Dillenia turbinata TaxID=194707 RepID=A0AAN8W1Y9_9MAGN
MPTGANIKQALKQMVDIGGGDILFFHYSGHGTLIPLKPTHPFRQHEAIVPCNFNLITGLWRSDRQRKIASWTIFNSHPTNQLPLLWSPSLSISRQAWINTSDVATHLLELFGELASLCFRLPHHEINLIKTDMGILLSECQKDETICLPSILVFIVLMLMLMQLSWVDLTALIFN